MTTDINETIQNQFANVAHNYVTSSVHAQGIDLSSMLEIADLRGDEVVLDAGCGAGHTALAFAPNVQHVTAYDLTPAMLEHVEHLATARNLSNIRTRLGDVSNLPFEDKSFDLVVSRYSAHHWQHPEIALREFSRVLKPQGKFVLSDVVSYDDYAEDTFLQAIELLRDISHIRDHRISEWESLFVKAGFQFELHHQFDVSLEFNSWIKRMATPDRHADMIKTLFSHGPAEVRSAFRLAHNWQEQEDFIFVIPGAVMAGYLTTI